MKFAAYMAFSLFTFFHILLVPFFTVVNVVLRRIFRPERDEVTGEWRRLHNEELNDLYWGMEEIA